MTTVSFTSTTPSKGKLLESQELVTQASNNTKAQFATPPLSKKIINAVMDAPAAQTVMS
jgi:type I restriction enzyme R subunit